MTVLPIEFRETDKSWATAEKIIDAFGDFGLVRKEPVLVVGGGLTTDIAGFACSIFRRSTNYIRIPTTLIGLIDASVAIKVAVNHGKAKNRLGAFHASQQVLLDFSFLETLPTEQIRNGMAELIKIAVVGNSDIFETLEKHGEDLLRDALRTGRQHARAARDRRPALLRRDRDHARARDAEPARARPRPGHRLRSHLEPDARARAPTRRSSTARRSRSTWR